MNMSPMALCGDASLCSMTDVIFSSIWCWAKMGRNTAAFYYPAICPLPKSFIIFLALMAHYHYHPAYTLSVVGGVRCGQLRFRSASIFMLGRSICSGTLQGEHYWQLSRVRLCAIVLAIWFHNNVVCLSPVQAQILTNRKSATVAFNHHNFQIPADEHVKFLCSNVGWKFGFVELRHFGSSAKITIAEKQCVRHIHSTTLAFIFLNRHQNISANFCSNYFYVSNSIERWFGDGVWNFI